MYASCEHRDAIIYARQELERGECLAVDPQTALARVWPARVTWRELGRPVVEAAGFGEAWAALEGRPISRTDVGDRAVRHGVGVILQRALERLALPSAYHALDFTGVPLTESVLGAILEVADRDRERGLMVIAEPVDALYLARRWR